MSTVLTACIGIFWDYENCRPSSNISGAKLVENICQLVRGSGAITQFKAYVDVSTEVAQPRSIAFHSELQSSGVTLVYCPHNGKKDVADKMMIVDILAFALDRPPPAKIVIITGDRDFAYASAILRLRGYETVIISPSNMGHASLKMQADQLFDWKKDVIDVASPDASVIVGAVSQPTGIIATEDHRPKLFGTPETRPAAKMSATGTCLGNPVLNNTVESSTNMNTLVDDKPSPKETTVPPEKSLSTVLSGVPNFSQASSFTFEVPFDPCQPVAFSDKSMDVSNEPGCILSNSLKGQVAGSCSCAICSRLSGAKQELSGVGLVPTAKQPACSEQPHNSCNRVEGTVDSSTNTPSSVPTVTSSSNVTGSADTGFPGQLNPFAQTFYPFPSLESTKTFRPVVSTLFKPLVTRLCIEAPGYALPQAKLRTYFEKEHPSIYESPGRKKGKGFKKYLRTAINQGVICIIVRDSGRWVKLTEEYCSGGM